MMRAGFYPHLAISAIGKNKKILFVLYIDMYRDDNDELYHSLSDFFPTASAI